MSQLTVGGGGGGGDNRRADKELNGVLKKNVKNSRQILFLKNASFNVTFPTVGASKHLSRKIYLSHN